MNITFLTTKLPALSSGSEVRNYHLLQALINDSEIKKINLIYVSLSNTQSSHDIVKNKRVTTWVLPLKNRVAKNTLLSYIQGNIPYVQHLKKHPHSDQLTQIISDSDVLLLSELDSYFIAENLLNKKYAFT